MKPKSSYLTITDQFCGAGGSSLGAQAAGGEIGAAMAFPDTYVVLGNSREKVRQYGNAVTPPVMRMIIERCVESLQ